MTPIRVAYDCHVFTWQRYGGVARYFVELGTRVARAADFAAEVVAPAHVSPYLRDAGLTVRGFYTPRVPERAGRLFRAANRAGSVAYLRTFPPNVLHETYYGSWAYRPPKAAVVVTVHDMIHEKLAHLYPGDQTAARKADAVRRADLVLCVSEHTRRDLMEVLGVAQERTRVTHLGAGLPEPAFRDAYAAPPLARPYLLYVGDRGFQKNFPRLLEAYAASSRLRDEFVVVVFGRQPLQRGELELMRRLNLPDGRVLHVTGNDDVLARYYTHAAALAYTSLYEGFGLPPLEAMSLGCPVVCSDASALPETAGAAALLADPASTDAWRDALERVAYERALRDDLVARGREHARRFTWERCAAQTMAVYRELAG